MRLSLNAYSPPWKLKRSEVNAVLPTIDMSFHAAVVARAVGAELAAIEGQAVDFLGRDLPAAQGLRQGAAVIRTQDRQHRHPFADLHFGLRNTRLERHAEAPEFIRRPAIVIQRQQLRAAGTAPAIELQRIQPQHIHTEPYRALGEAGLGVEDETLRPLLRAALGFGRVGEIAVDRRNCAG